MPRGVARRHDATSRSAARVRHCALNPQFRAGGANEAFPEAAWGPSDQFRLMTSGRGHAGAK
jgi:hypothetical protein